MKRLALVLFCIAAGAIAADAQQQQQKAGYNGLSWTSPLEVSIGPDRNFLVDRLTPEQRLFYLSFSPTFQRETPLNQPKEFDDTVMLLTGPTLSFVSDSPLRQLSFSYKPEFEFFNVNRDQNAWNHDANIEFFYWMNRRVNFSIRDAYRSSKDPSRTLQNIFLLLPRSRYQENAFRGQVSYDLSQRTNITARFDNTLTKFGEIDPFQVRVLDSWANSGSLIATRMVRSNQRLRGTYSIFKIYPIEKTGVADEGVNRDAGLNRATHLLTAEYRISIDRSNVVEFSGGGVNSQSGTSYVLGVSGDHRFGNVWVGGSYSRSAAFFSGNTTRLANGLKADEMFQVISFRMRGEPLRRVAITSSVVGSMGAGSLIVDRSRSLMGRLRVDYRLSDRLSTYVGGETYQQNSNAYVNAPLTRARVYVGLQYSFTSEEERRINRLNRDADYVSLTERDRRNRGPQ